MSIQVHEGLRRVRCVPGCLRVWLLCEKPGHTRRNTKSHCPRATGSSLRKPSQWQGRGSVELIRPLGLALRQQFLLLILGDSPHIRTKRDKVSLKVFLSPLLVAHLQLAAVRALDCAIRQSWRLSLQRKWSRVTELIDSASQYCKISNPVKKKKKKSGGCVHESYICTDRRYPFIKNPWCCILIKGKPPERVWSSVM